MALFSAKAAAQCDLELGGQINDEDNHEHLAFSVVQLQPGNKVVQSDLHGNFTFDKLCAGVYTITVSHVGCRDTSITVSLERTVRLPIKLPHSLNALKDVEIVTTHEEHRPVQTSAVLKTIDLDRVRGTSVAEQMAELPGVAVLRSGPTVSKPVVNGMQGYRVLLLNNGVRLEAQQWGSEHAPEIDGYAAKRITLVKGASAVRYGSDAIGGVFIIEPDPLPDTAAITAEIQSSFASNGKVTSNSALVQGYFDQLKHLSWRIQGSYKNGGYINTPQYYLRNTSVRERNFSYAVAYHRKKFGIGVYYSQFNSDLGIFSGAHFGNLTDLNNAIARVKPADSMAAFSRELTAPRQQVEHELIKVDADLHTGPRSRFNVLYALQYNVRKEFDAHGAAQGEADPAAHFNLGSHNGELSWEHDYIRSWRGRFGLQTINQKNLSYGSAFIPNYEVNSIGFFAIERFVRAHYEIEGGLRYDERNQQAFYYSNGVIQQPEDRFNNLSYSLGALYRAASIRLSITAASGWRAPAMNELYANGLHHGAAAIERGNKNLNKEVGSNVVASAEGSWEKFRAQLSLYAYDFSNYIYFVPSLRPELTLRGAFPVFTYTQGSVFIGGGDLSMAWAFTSFSDLKSKIMQVRGWNRSRGEDLIFMPADRYEFSLRLHRDLRPKIKEVYLEPGVLIVSRQNRAPEGQDFSPPPAGYFIFNLEAGFQLHTRQQPFFITFSLRNILNTPYREYLDRFRYFSDAQGINFVVRLRAPISLYDKK